jgi:murein DD-endopeptidase MepM/ murein hydrolase activator NlpD
MRCRRRSFPVYSLANGSPARCDEEGMLRRHRIPLLLFGLLIATFATSMQVQRQTALLPDASAAPPRPTPPVERQVDPEATPLPPEPAHESEEPGTPTTPAGPEVPPPPPPRAAIISHERFFYEPGWYATEIQAWLDSQPGPLKHYRAAIGNREHSFAEVLSSQTTLYSINPRVVLALIEQQSGVITNPSPSDEQIRFLLAYRGENEGRAGWMSQLRWAIRELHHAQRDFPDRPELAYADESHSPIPDGLSIADYAIARVLAQTTTAAGLPARLDGGDRSFVATYTRLFGDPRESIAELPPLAEPFLSFPAERIPETTSFFDHDAPFLRQNGSTLIYRGDRSEFFSYDGHDGWDFAMLPPEPILAPADGRVVFAGNSDDGCGVAHAVILEHGNGYRTLYWHLTRPTVEIGQEVARGETIGIVGSSGCSTGPHLHFQVQYLGRDVDPAGWCGPESGDVWASHPAGQISVWLWRDVPSPCDLPADAIVVHATDPGFLRLGDGWDEGAPGLNGSALVVQSALRDSTNLTIGVWRPDLPSAGRYQVLAWVPYILNGRNDARAVRYVVGHADGSGDSEQIVISQWNIGSGWGWADLGTHDLDPARAPFVGLTADDRERGNNVWYDAVVWIPVE